MSVRITECLTDGSDCGHSACPDKYPLSHSLTYPDGWSQIRTSFYHEMLKEITDLREALETISKRDPAGPECEFDYCGCIGCIARRALGAE